MIESDKDEERIARIEGLLETLQREVALNKKMSARLARAIAAFAPDHVADRRKRPRPRAS